jgi:hypothetical protein
MSNIHKKRLKEKKRRKDYLKKKNAMKEQWQQIKKGMRESMTVEFPKRRKYVDKSKLTNEKK